MNVRISTLPRALLNFTGQSSPSPRKLYEGAVSAKYPAHQVNGIWHYDEQDLPVIAAAYGLSPKKVRPERRRKVNSSSVSAAA